MNIAVEPRTLVEVGDAIDAAMDTVAASIDRLKALHDADPREVAHRLGNRLHDEALRLEWLAIPMRSPR